VAKHTHFTVQNTLFFSEKYSKLANICQKQITALNELPE
jgi:hypothetical protein